MIRHGGGIGRRAGFKIRFLHGSVGSIPTLGTTVKTSSPLIGAFLCNLLMCNLLRHPLLQMDHQVYFHAAAFCLNSVEFASGSSLLAELLQKPAESK